LYSFHSFINKHFIGAFNALFTGSKNANRYYISAVVILAAIVIAILFAVKNKADRLKTAKYNRLLNEQKMKHEMSLEPVKKTFDIEFEDLGLVLPSGITIMKVKN
jgi:hypothetical protein